MERSECDLLEVSTKHTFHRVMRAITGYRADMVGLCYSSLMSSGSYNVILYDSYTGKPVTRLTTTMSSLTGDPVIDKVTIRKIVGVEGDKLRLVIAGLILERTTPIGHKLERETIRSVLKYTLLRSAGLSPDGGCNNGFAIVNKILCSAASAKYDRTKPYDNIIEEYIGHRVSLAAPRNAHVERHDSFHDELTLLLEVCRELLTSNPHFIGRVIDTISDLSINNNRGMAFQVTIPECTAPPEEPDELRARYDTAMTTINTMVDHEMKLLAAMDTLDSGVVNGMVREINDYRRTINLVPVRLPATFQALDHGKQAAKRLTIEVERITKSMHDGSIPIINVRNIVDELNKINQVFGITNNITGEEVSDGSYPSLVVNPGYYGGEKDLTVPLKFGDTIVLPRYNADVGPVSTEVLTEVLFYLDALECSTNNFDSLKVIITHELAMRRSGPKAPGAKNGGSE